MSKIRAILWDIDGTLLNFDDSERYGIRKIFFQPYGIEIVKNYKGKLPQFIVTNGNKSTQDSKLELSGLGDICDAAYISEDIGAEKPSETFFDRIFELMAEQFPELSDLVEKSDRRREVLIVGDSLTSDMLGGNNANLMTCWYNPRGKVNDKGVIIDHEIGSLREIMEIPELCA